MTNPKTRVDISGKKFDKITVIEHVGNRHGNALWRCLCDCGEEVVLQSRKLRKAKNNSCGCGRNTRNYTKEHFIQHAVEIHKNKYDYSKVVYLGSKQPVEIICQEHGSFWQSPHIHIQKSGCKVCSNKQLNTQEFIKRSEILHNYKFNYKDVNYVNNSILIDISCPIHGIFQQSPATHLMGKGCLQCAWDNNSYSYNKRCKEPSFGSRAGLLYILKMSRFGEVFGKVGVSVMLEKRMKQYRKLGFDIEVIKTVDATAEECGKLEKDVLKFIKSTDIKYQPEHKFSGQSECFDINHTHLVLEFIDKVGK